MSKRQRLLNLGIAAVIAVVAVVVILATSGGEEEQEAASTPAPTPAETQPPRAEPQEEATSTPTVKPKEPPVPGIRVADGEVVGGLAEFRVDQGDRLRFTVASDIPEEIHVHAYDLYADVGPGQKARFDFKADIAGVVEVELHGSGTQIASIRVDP